MENLRIQAEASALKRPRMVWFQGKFDFNPATQLAAAGLLSTGTRDGSGNPRSAEEAAMAAATLATAAASGHGMPSSSVYAMLGSSQSPQLSKLTDLPPPIVAAIMTGSNFRVYVAGDGSVAEGGWKPSVTFAHAALTPMTLSSPGPAQPLSTRGASARRAASSSAAAAAATGTMSGAAVMPTAVPSVVSLWQLPVSGLIAMGLGGFAGREMYAPPQQFHRLPQRYASTPDAVSVELIQKTQVLLRVAQSVLHKRSEQQRLCDQAMNAVNSAPGAAAAADAADGKGEGKGKTADKAKRAVTQQLVLMDTAKAQELVKRMMDDMDDDFDDLDEGWADEDDDDDSFASDASSTHNDDDDDNDSDEEEEDTGRKQKGKSDSKGLRGRDRVAGDSDGDSDSGFETSTARGSSGFGKKGGKSFKTPTKGSSKGKTPAKSNAKSSSKNDKAVKDSNAKGKEKPAPKSASKKGSGKGKFSKRAGSDSDPTFSDDDDTKKNNDSGDDDDSDDGGKWGKGKGKSKNNALSTKAPAPVIIDATGKSGSARKGAVPPTPATAPLLPPPVTLDAAGLTEILLPAARLLRHAVAHVEDWESAVFARQQLRRQEELAAAQAAEQAEANRQRSAQAAAAAKAAAVVAAAAARGPPTVTVLIPGASAAATTSPAAPNSALSGSESSDSVANVFKKVPAPVVVGTPNNASATPLSSASTAIAGKKRDTKGKGKGKGRKAGAASSEELPHVQSMFSDDVSIEEDDDDDGNGSAAPSDGSAFSAPESAASTPSGVSAPANPFAKKKKPVKTASKPNGDKAKLTQTESIPEVTEDDEAGAVRDNAGGFGKPKPKAKGKVKKALKSDASQTGSDSDSDLSMGGLEKPDGLATDESKTKSDHESGIDDKSVEDDDENEDEDEDDDVIDVSTDDGFRATHNKNSVNTDSETSPTSAPTPTLHRQHTERPRVAVAGISTAPVDSFPRDETLTPRSKPVARARGGDAGAVSLSQTAGRVLSVQRTIGLRTKKRLVDDSTDTEKDDEAVDENDIDLESDHDEDEDEDEDEDDYDESQVGTMTTRARRNEDDFIARDDAFGHVGSFDYGEPGASRRNKPIMDAKADVPRGQEEGVALRTRVADPSRVTVVASIATAAFGNQNIDLDAAASTARATQHDTRLVQQLLSSGLKQESLTLAQFLERPLTTTVLDAHDVLALLSAKQQVEQLQTQLALITSSVKLAMFEELTHVLFARKPVWGSVRLLVRKLVQWNDLLPTLPNLTFSEVNQCNAVLRKHKRPAMTNARNVMLQPFTNILQDLASQFVDLRFATVVEPMIVKLPKHLSRRYFLGTDAGPPESTTASSGKKSSAADELANDLGLTLVEVYSPSEGSATGEGAMRDVDAAASGDTLLTGVLERMSAVAQDLLFVHESSQTLPAVNKLFVFNYQNFFARVLTGPLASELLSPTQNALVAAWLAFYESVLNQVLPGHVGSGTREQISELYNQYRSTYLATVRNRLNRACQNILEDVQQGRRVRYDGKMWYTDGPVDLFSLLHQCFDVAYTKQQLGGRVLKDLFEILNNAQTYYVSSLIRRVRLGMRQASIPAPPADAEEQYKDMTKKMNGDKSSSSSYAADTESNIFARSAASKAARKAAAAQAGAGPRRGSLPQVNDEVLWISLGHNDVISHTKVVAILNDEALYSSNRERLMERVEAAIGVWQAQVQSHEPSAGTEEDVKETKEAVSQLNGRTAELFGDFAQYCVDALVSAVMVRARPAMQAFFTVKWSVDPLNTVNEWLAIVQTNANIVLSSIDKSSVWPGVFIRRLLRACTWDYVARFTVAVLKEKQKTVCIKEIPPASGGGPEAAAAATQATANCVAQMWNLVQDDRRTIVQFFRGSMLRMDALASTDAATALDKAAIKEDVSLLSYVVAAGKAGPAAAAATVPDIALLLETQHVSEVLPDLTLKTLVDAAYTASACSPQMAETAYTAGITAFSRARENGEIDFSVDAKTAQKGLVSSLFSLISGSDAETTAAIAGGGANLGRGSSSLGVPGAGGLAGRLEGGRGGVVDEFELYVVVETGRNLPARNDDGVTSDPYALVRLQGLDLHGLPKKLITKRKTEAVERSVDPDWYEVLKFTTAETMATHTVDVSINDWNFIYSDTFMGAASVTMRSIVEQCLQQRASDPSLAGSTTTLSRSASALAAAGNPALRGLLFQGQDANLGGAGAVPLVGKSRKRDAVLKKMVEYCVSKKRFVWGLCVEKLALSEVATGPASGGKGAEAKEKLKQLADSKAPRGGDMEQYSNATVMFVLVAKK